MGCYQTKVETMAQIYFQGKPRKIIQSSGSKTMLMSITLQEIRKFDLNKLPDSQRPLEHYYRKNVVLQAVNERGEVVAYCHTEADLRELVRTLKNPNQIRLEALEEAQAERERRLTEPLTREALVVVLTLDPRRRQYSGQISFDGRRVILVAHRDDSRKVQPGQLHLCRFANEMDSGAGFRVWLVYVTKALPDLTGAITALKAKIKAGQT